MPEMACSNSDKTFRDVQLAAGEDRLEVIKQWHGAVESGAVESGAVESGAVESGAVESGAVDGRGCLAAVQNNFGVCGAAVSAALCRRDARTTSYSWTAVYSSLSTIHSSLSTYFPQ